jgi:predicted RNA-binding Zn-ribbon protein involved in translation (DUF1610 family)
MVREKPIKCSCGEIVVKDEKSIQHMVLEKDIKCPKCGRVVVAAPKTEYSPPKWAGVAVRKPELSNRFPGSL